MTAVPRGFRHTQGHFEPAMQREVVEAIRAVVRTAPLYVPAMPKTGNKMSVRMTNCGTIGWVTDRDGGYRYQPLHPVTRQPWPPIPCMLARLWREIAGYPHPPEACLVNFYDATARMGQHEDRDEKFLGAGGFGFARR